MPSIPASSIAQLADELAEWEDWEYHNTQSERQRPILLSYLRYTYARLAEEGKIAISPDGQRACFNTGLGTPDEEDIFALFVRNKIPDQQPWFLQRWCREGQGELCPFGDLPRAAHYFDDPSLLVFDARKTVRVDWEHLMQDDHLPRFPEPYAGMSRDLLRKELEHATNRVVKRVSRNYRLAVPQYYNGVMQLLLPVCLGESRRAEVALTAELKGSFYHVATCLSLDMAYNNARLIAKPDRDWLQP